VNGEVKENGEYNVRAIERALQILDCFDARHPDRGLTEIAQQVGLHKATTHRIVMTLLNSGYLDKSPDGQKYRLGLRLASLGSIVTSQMNLRRDSLPYMTQLCERFEEACDLSIFDNGEVLYIEVLRSNHALNIAAAIGQRLPLHCTASGKIFLAHMPLEDREKYLHPPLASFTAKTITGVEKLNKQFKEILSKGYGMDDEEIEVGIRAISAPIFNKDGKVAAAVSVPGPTTRMSDERIPEIAAGLLETAALCSRRQGWTV
jgi:IclR family transcriptional regulator, KDG regulon repressor